LVRDDRPLTESPAQGFGGKIGTDQYHLLIKGSFFSLPSSFWLEKQEESVNQMLSSLAHSECKILAQS
jgi:hypothetical protein